MKNFQLKARILSQTKVKNNYWHCEFSAPQLAKISQPGQFINIRVSDKCEPLLRRPLSIHGTSGAKIKILYEVVGRATEVLAQKKAGESLDIIGPLGNGFSVNGFRSAVIVGGGMGVAPLIFLAEKLAEVKKSLACSSRQEKSQVRTMVLIGAKSREQLLCVKEFKKLGYDVKISTDDGSAGSKGRVTELLKDLLGAASQKPEVTIYACGPRPMLKAVSDLSSAYAIPAQVSLEEHMSCGIGACLGCVVKVKSDFEYKRVCKEGPVFNSAELTW